MERAGTFSEEETLKRTTFENAVCDQCGARRAITGVEQKEKFEDEEQRGLRYKVKDCVAARVTEDWSQEQICNRLPCRTWMKATYLDDEQWCRVDDETSLEDGLKFEETLASGFESETVDEEEECENIGGDGLKSSTLADLPRLSMCSPKSKHLSPGKRRLNIPARSPGTPEVGTRKTRNDPAEDTPNSTGGGKANMVQVRRKDQTH